MKEALPTAVNFPAIQTIRPSRLPFLVLQRLRERFDVCCVVDLLEYATGGDFYVFGGTIRRVLFNDSGFGDLDIMVPNDDPRAFEALDSLKVPLVRERKRHRYLWNDLQIDLIRPNEFYRGFQDVDSALGFFDLKINALALHLRSRQIHDPFKVHTQPQLTDPGINWQRWNDMPLTELVVLAIRLVKVMHENPAFTISMDDADLLLAKVVPKIRECEWSNVQHRFPLGKDVFLQMFDDKLLRRTRPAGK